jgi:tRNA(adenine34) deaminase
MNQEQDEVFMGTALAYAAQAAALHEVPVGAVLVSAEGRMLAGAGNCCVAACDPVGHAEIRVLRAAAEKVSNYRLPGTALYVTLEPCPMCAAALVMARVARVVFGAADPKTGALQSVYRIGSDGGLNHRFTVTGGIRAEECSSLLKTFFQQRREKKNGRFHFSVVRRTELGLNAETAAANAARRLWKGEQLQTRLATAQER